MRPPLLLLRSLSLLPTHHPLSCACLSSGWSPCGAELACLLRGKLSFLVDQESTMTIHAALKYAASAVRTLPWWKQGAHQQGC